MTRFQMAFLWGLFIIAATLLCLEIGMPGPSIAILVSGLSAGAAISLNRGNRSGCKKA